MARRPVKKRKQRAISKKTVFKKVKALVDRNFAADPEAEKDPFYIDPKSIPKGKSYQWVATHIDGKPFPGFVRMAIGVGWKPVRGHKPVGGQILMWAPQKVADALRKRDIERAQQLMQEMRDILRMDVSTDHSHRVPLVSESFLASEPYESIPSDTPPIDVEVKVNFRLSAHFQESAALLKIDPQVYAQRRIALYLRGELGGILLPVYAVSHTNERGPKENALELFEGGNFNIQSRI